MSKLQANLLLLLAAAFWGAGNIAQKTVLAHLDAFSAVGLRFLLGGLLIVPLIGSLRQVRLSGAYGRSLFRVAAPFALGMVLQQFAFADTSVTNAGFLVSAATVLTPLFAWLLAGERPGATVVLAATITLGGVALLSGGLGGGLGRGDLLAIGAAVCFALWMVELSRHLQAHGGVAAAACGQFLLTAVVTLPFGFASGGMSASAVLAAGPELLFLGVFSTALGFGLQTLALRFTTSSHAAVMVSAESVFGALGGAVLLSERVSPMQGLGCALVLGALLLLARPPRALPDPVVHAA